MLKNTKKNKMLKSLFLLLISALSKTNYGNSIGNDFQKFNPNASGIDFVTVEPSQTMAKGKISTSIVTEYCTNTLPLLESENNKQSLLTINDYTLNSHLTAAWGISENFELSLKLPFILTKSSTEDNSNYEGQIIAAGMTYLGLGIKYLTFKKSTYGLALGADLGTDLMHSNPYVGDTTPFFMTVYSVIDGKFKGIKLSANAGYKLRTTGEPILNEDIKKAPIEPISGEFIYSLGSAYPLSKNKSVTLEIYGSSTASQTSDQSDRGSYSAEVLAAFKGKLKSKMNISAGAGTDLSHGVGSADIRIFAGMSYEFKAPKLPKFGSGKTKKNNKKQNQTDGFYDNDYYEAPEESEPEESYIIEETELPSFEEYEDFSIE